MNRNRGFTLIELLVVIAMIGLLSSIIIVSLAGSRGKARVAQGQALHSQISHALGAEAVGAWHHIAMVFDGTGPTLKIYVDGRLEDTQNPGVSAIDTGSGDFFIGARAPGVEHFEGEIDNFFLSLEAFSTSHLQKVYADGLLKRQFAQEKMWYSK